MIHRAFIQSVVSTIALAAAHAFVLGAPLFTARAAHADLGWFDISLSDDRPYVSFAEVIAWSDACLAVTDTEWPAVERVYAGYVKQWNGDGRDEDKLWEGLTNTLGPERAGCIDAFRATTDAILRTRDTSSRHILVRRQLLEIAAMRGPLAPNARRVARELGIRIAGAVTERPPSDFYEAPPVTEVITIRDAVLNARAGLVAVAGEERADAMLANIVQAYELSGTTALSYEFRIIIENASRLTVDERTRLAAAYAAADAKLRSKAAYENPREARTQADEELFKEIEAILGVDRADLIRALAGGYVDVNAHPDVAGPRANTPMHEIVNSASDALLGRFVGAAEMQELEGLGGRPFWRPLPNAGLRSGATAEPHPIETSFLTAVAGAKGDDELAIVESIQVDSARRYAQAEHSYERIMAKEARVAGIADMSLIEDERVLSELQTAFGIERIPASTVALARFARLEQTLPFAKITARFDTLTRIPWPNGSVACEAFGERQAGVPPLPSSHRAQLRAVLTESADALLAGRLAAWHDVQSANTAFDRVLEQFAGHSGIARDRLVAMQAARLVGLSACANAARRSYVEVITLVERLASENRIFDAQYIALALIQQNLGNTDAGRRLEGELARTQSTEMRDRALTALIPVEPSAAELLRASSEAAIAAGNMDDGDLGRIEAGNAVLTVMKEGRRRLDRAMRAQVASAWRELRSAGNSTAADAFKP